MPLKNHSTLKSYISVTCVRLPGGRGRERTTQFVLGVVRNFKNAGGPGSPAKTWSIVLHPLLHEKTKGIVTRSTVPSASPSVYTRLTGSLIQCDRQYPCNHCSHRRRPEQCAYYRAIQAASPPLQTNNRREDNAHSGDGQLKHTDDHELIDFSPKLKEIRRPINYPGFSSLAELFGYYEDSKSNTMALLRRVSSTSLNIDPLYPLLLQAVVTIVDR